MVETPDETIWEASRTDQFRHIYVEKLCIVTLAADDPMGYLSDLLRRIARKPKGCIRLDEGVPLQLSGGLGKGGTQEDSGLQEGAL